MGCTTVAANYGQAVYRSQTGSLKFKSREDLLTKQDPRSLPCHCPHHAVCVERGREQPALAPQLSYTFLRAALLLRPPQDSRGPEGGNPSTGWDGSNLNLQVPSSRGTICSSDMVQQSQLHAWAYLTKDRRGFTCTIITLEATRSKVPSKLQ